MDYAEQVKIMRNAHDFTFTEYNRLKRKPSKVETTKEKAVSFDACGFIITAGKLADGRAGLKRRTFVQPAAGLINFRFGH
jgi:hypothetical protein